MSPSQRILQTQVLQSREHYFFKRNTMLSAARLWVCRTLYCIAFPFTAYIFPQLSDHDRRRYATYQLVTKLALIDWLLSIRLCIVHLFRGYKFKFTDGQRCTGSSLADQTSKSTAAKCTGTRWKAAFDVHIWADFTVIGTFTENNDTQSGRSSGVERSELLCTILPSLFTWRRYRRKAC
ncbi:hypothetical protein Agabi119p4_8036 [Agaricus bisporus var. burnettii]|uniref:Uncharacterized protein n=1 Tax=Agaricus bisporus var. burnettii TaxID=192524 RepID=A0A8H7EYM3_AGABI|nr:hypothetical protein Agabi119p4_8036 [Agaricus bisporus var. burnettii]